MLIENKEQISSRSLYIILIVETSRQKTSFKILEQDGSFNDMQNMYDTHIFHPLH